MRKAIVVDANDIKSILAEHFHVKQEDVIKSQYSYTVIIGKPEPLQLDLLSEEKGQENEEM